MENLKDVENCPNYHFEKGDICDIDFVLELFRKYDIDGVSNIDIERLAFLVCRGGWPQAVDMREEIALDQAMDYYDAVVHSDINRADNVQKNPDKVRRLMRSYARNQGGQVPNTVLAQDVSANDETPISEETVAAYLNALRKIFVVEDMPAWNPNLRSKTAIRSSDTRYYVDPSIAAAALGIGPSDLLNDLKTFGFLFETLCIRDLRVFADAAGGEVYHYRDKDGQECDAVIHLRNGKYGLIEIKLGGEKLIEEGAKSLKAMEAKIDTDKMNTPSFLMVLTGIGDYAYRRDEDGVDKAVGAETAVGLGMAGYERRNLDPVAERHVADLERSENIGIVLVHFYLVVSLQCP